MPIRRAVGSIVIVAVALAGAVAASARPGDVALRYGTSSLPEHLTPQQAEAIATLQSDSPIPVQDERGEPRGFVRDSALVARDERVTATLIGGFRERTGPVDHEYDELYEALRVLDPVPVVDADGETVGYWTHDFKEIDELEQLTPGAQATVDLLLG